MNAQLKAKAAKLPEGWESLSRDKLREILEIKQMKFEEWKEILNIEEDRRFQSTARKMFEKDSYVVKVEKSWKTPVTRKTYWRHYVSLYHSPEMGGWVRVELDRLCCDDSYGTWCHGVEFQTVEGENLRTGQHFSMHWVA
ncbi:hypothetical protein KKD19_02230 [Patescibacteria group bacterium]|nr:hypothetical protein [Patescibacteria group bacterium]MCG2693265.1 hypothetical protein [Candidatus Parcubacteria bacterium]